MSKGHLTGTALLLCCSLLLSACHHDSSPESPAGNTSAAVTSATTSGSDEPKTTVTDAVSSSTTDDSVTGFATDAPSPETSAAPEITAAWTEIASSASADSSSAPTTATAVPPLQNTPAAFTAGSIQTDRISPFRYYLYTPSDPTDDMPLIVYLHGGSGKGDDLTILTTIDGFPKYLRSGELGDVRAYVLMPQLPANQKGWSDAAESVYTLIQQTVVRFALDPHNVSLTGHSMGGTGTFALATTYPRLFARIAPLSGSVRTTPETLRTLKSIPMKVFVGAADTIVSPASSEELVQALNGMGGQADIAVFENADHFAVPALTYLDERIDLISWLIDAL